MGDVMDGRFRPIGDADPYDLVVVVDAKKDPASLRVGKGNHLAVQTAGTLLELDLMAFTLLENEVEIFLVHLMKSAQIKGLKATACTC